VTGRPRVLVSGPAPPAQGGVASVIALQLESPLAERFELERFATSERRHRARGVAGRAIASLRARAFGFDGAFNPEASAQLRAFQAALATRPALVHLHCAHGWDFWLSVRMARMARRAGVPSLLHLHGNFDVVVPRWSRARRACFARALAIPDRVVVLSESWKKWFEPWLPAERIAVIHNGIDVGRFHPRDACATERGALRILFVGLRDPEIKGAHDLLAAAAEIVREAPDVRFVLAGEDTERLEDRVVRGTPLAAHCEFTGRLSEQEITKRFEEADMLVVPSRRDAAPLAVLEGMAAGLPIVASRTGAIPELLGEPAGGAWIDPGDRAGLARAVLALRGDPARARAIGAANRERALRDFDRDRCAEKLAALYEQVAGGVA
jgi:glycosyltransferase involved in cell wall biosynthesis